MADRELEHAIEVVMEAFPGATIESVMWVDRKGKQEGFGVEDGSAGEPSSPERSSGPGSIGAPRVSRPEPLTMDLSQERG